MCSRGRIAEWDTAGDTSDVTMRLFFSTHKVSVRKILL